MKLANFSEPLTLFKTDIIFTWVWKISAVILSGTLVFVLFIWQKLPPYIPFFYSLPWGEKQLAQPLVLLGTIFGAILVLGLNSIFALYFHKNSSFLSHILIISGGFVTLLACITVIQIVLLVT